MANWNNYFYLVAKRFKGAGINREKDADSRIFYGDQVTVIELLPYGLDRGRDKLLPIEVIYSRSRRERAIPTQSELAQHI